MDFERFFNQYLALRDKADDVFKKISEQYPECVTCKIGCSDCCHALFDLSLIEALYINSQFNKIFQGQEKERLLEKANRADRKIYKVKRKAHKELEAGKSESQILEEIAAVKIRCPMLNDDDQCEIYDIRPITCRLYGVPTAINGTSHTCGLTGFEQGKPYPTVNLEQIHRRLYEICLALATSIKTRYPGLPQILVPLSMALMTEYNEEYLGTKNEKSAETDSPGCG